jgi:hypothetical protein
LREGADEHHVEELHGIIDEKLTAFVRELEDANWSVDEIVFTIEAILEKNWLVQARALRAARDSRAACRIAAT